MRREPAWRIFAAEYNDASLEIKGTGEKTPSYVVTPLGSKVIYKKIDIDSNSIKTVSIENIKSGIYFVVLLFHDGYILNKKIIIEK